MDYFLLIITAMFISNIVLVQYLGTCPFLGTSKAIGVAMGMGSAVLFVMTLATALTWAIQHWLLTPYDVEYLQTIVFILVIASLVQLVEMFLRKFVTPLYQSLGIYLPLITTNCAVLGVAILVQRSGYPFLKAVVFTMASAGGFMLALVIIAAIREQFETAPIPRVFQGTPIALVTAGVMSLAFYAFKGMGN